MAPVDPVTKERIARNLAAVREQIATAAARTSRAPASVRLVAVTKSAGNPETQALLELGVNDLGESRIQAAEPKLKAFRAAGFPSVHWHLIGHVQTNKAGKAAQWFDFVHALDSPRLAQALDTEARKVRPPADPLPCLIEVNVAGEASKFGLKPELAGLAELLRVCADCGALRIRGLMTMAPFSDDPAATSRPVFRRLRELRDELNAKSYYPEGLSELSMGMSQDYPIAVEEGATLVRVGTALFQ